MVVPSPTITADKVLLRQQSRAARRAFVDALSIEERAALEARLGAHLTPLVRRARVVGAYSPMAVEISSLPALAGAATAAFPAFDLPGSPFRFLAGEPVEPGPLQILQPRLSSPEVMPDLVLVPLVASDRVGNRLGQGKGHYDRVLGALKTRGALLLGVGWELQLIDTMIPADPWDVPLDGFASPDGVRMWR